MFTELSSQRGWHNNKIYPIPDPAPAAPAAPAGASPAHASPPPARAAFARDRAALRVQTILNNFPGLKYRTTNGRFREIRGFYPAVIARDNYIIGICHDGNNYHSIYNSLEQRTALRINGRTERNLTLLEILLINP